MAAAGPGGARGGERFFVSAEFAIITVRKTRIDQLVAEGHRRARAVRRAVSRPDRYIAATQLGITMASLGLGWIGEPALASIIQPSVAFLPARIADATAHSVAVAVAFTCITAVDIVFGELVPKWIALERIGSDGDVGRHADRALHARAVAVHPAAPRHGADGHEGARHARRGAAAARRTRRKS